ncbi:Ectonucleoside triphosphate diphosphohydrolase 5, partial [Stegodyphus mimosarum]
MDAQHKLKWSLYITLATLFIFLSVTELGHFSSAKKSLFPTQIPETSDKHVIVFDGGSTGTRIHVFSFVNSSSGLLILKDEYFEEVKPGLSNFANKPKKAAKSVFHLLEKAKAFVPPNSWDQTPITLKATAGLRLLPSYMSDSILEEVSKTFHDSPFLCDKNCVSVLDGKDEGLYAWFTLNFLLGRLHEPNHSVASLDLGGGSTQVTFSPVDLDTVVFSPKDYIVKRKVLNKTMSIYTHSYLGLGLMSARLSILKLSNVKSDHSENESSFTSSCIHPNVNVKWKFDLNEYNVSGRADEQFGFKYCYDKAVKFLGDSVDQPEELLKREVYALSYYYDRAVDLK